MPVKAGYKTTEFYVALAAAILPVLKEFVLPELPSEAILTAMGVAATYIFGRSMVKKAAS